MAFKNGQSSSSQKTLQFVNIGFNEIIAYIFHAKSLAKYHRLTLFSGNKVSRGIFRVIAWPVVYLLAVVKCVTIRCLYLKQGHLSE